MMNSMVPGATSRCDIWGQDKSKAKRVPSTALIFWDTEYIKNIFSSFNNNNKKICVCPLKDCTERQSMGVISISQGWFPNGCLQSLCPSATLTRKHIRDYRVALVVKLMSSKLRIHRLSFVLVQQSLQLEHKDLEFPSPKAFNKRLERHLSGNTVYYSNSFYNMVNRSA